MLARLWPWPVTIQALIAAILVYLAHGHFAITFNASESLPASAYLVIKGTQPRLGEVVQFRYMGEVGYPKGKRFLKLVEGLAGDEVYAKDRDYWVSGHHVGLAKPFGAKGQSLEPGPVGTIPPGKYFVATPHPDSFDSRYAAVGWIDHSQIIGRAVPIF